MAHYGLRINKTEAPDKTPYTICQIEALIIVWGLAPTYVSKAVVGQ